MLQRQVFLRNSAKAIVLGLVTISLISVSLVGLSGDAAALPKCGSPAALPCSHRGPADLGCNPGGVGGSLGGLEDGIDLPPGPPGDNVVGEPGFNPDYDPTNPKSYPCPSTGQRTGNPHHRPTNRGAAK